MLALLDVDFSKLLKNKKDHAQDILAELKLKGGLDYVPRERTPQGRLLEHASDCRSLIMNLALTESTETDI